MKTKVMAIGLGCLLVLCMIAAVGYAAYGRVSGGSGAGGNRSGTGALIEPTWIDASVDGNSVKIPISKVEPGKIVNFRVTYDGSDMAFTAYRLGDQTYIRTALCPPCRSESFSLDGDVLDCDTCHTRFSATSGEGLKGACRAYPKAEVRYTTGAEEISMSITDLVAAYQETRIPG